MKHPDKRLVASVIDRFYTTLQKPLSQQTRHRITAGAAILFVAVSVVSILALGGIELHPIWLVGAALVTPLVQLGNAAEYRVMGKLIDQDVGWWEALELTTFATAANLLPIPGGAILRVRELGARSGNFRSAALAMATVAVFWLGAALLIAAFGLGVLGHNFTLAIFCCAALLALGFGAYLAPKSNSHPVRTLVALASLEGAISLAAGIRIAAIMAGLGLKASLPTAMVLATSGPMAALVGIVPGGLGLQELIAGVLAPLAAAAPEAGAASVAADRVVGYLALAVGAAAIWVGGRIVGSTPLERAEKN